MELKGIHHVSSLTANALVNLEFYTKVLGLRLVKKTVNQDHPSNYHLFYGDEKGNPGTELTFFEIPNLAKNHRGTNSISNTSFRVLNDSAIHFWKKRFEVMKVIHEPIQERFGHQILPFYDHDGHRMVLISDQYNSGVAGGSPNPKADIPHEYGIIGLGPVHLTVRYLEPTKQVLIDVLRFREKGQYTWEESTFHVFETGEGGNGAEIHIEQRKDLPEERNGRGGVHHVAFRVNNDEELHKWVEIIKNEGFQTSGFVDRYYFHSLYFTEPNGILFELATDGPGFHLDESSEELGDHLSLPPFLEPQREQIEAKLKPLHSLK